jgi:hypothetical protein
MSEENIPIAVKKDTKFPNFKNISNFNLLNKYKSEFKSIDLKYPIPFIICVVIIALYGKYRCDNITNHKDILEFSLFKGSERFHLDGWTITHFSFFLLIGYLYPNTLFISMTIGVIWELMETFVGVMKPKMILGYGFCELPGNKYKVWWYGKWSDPIVNFFGFLLGKRIYKMVKK